MQGTVRCRLCGIKTERYQGMYARCRPCALKRSEELRRARELLPMVCNTCGLEKPRYSGSSRMCKECHSAWARARLIAVKGQPIVCGKCGKPGVKVARHRLCYPCALERKQGGRVRRNDRERDLLARPRTPRDPREQVYFVVDEASDGAIKIGWTMQPIAKRLEMLQNGNPNPLRVVLSVPGGRVDEKRLHWRFEHLRRLNEWFRPGPDLLAHIAALIKAQPSLAVP